MQGTSMPRLLAVGLILGLGLASTHADAQGVSTAGKRRLLPLEEEIRLARSAAPAEVSARATVYVLGEAGYEVAAAGDNGVSCLVNRSQPESLEPHCYDAEASATILRIELLRAELRQQGAEQAAIDAAIGAALAKGELRLPRRPAMSYMMSSAQVLFNDRGERVGAWRPHLMIYYPYLEPEDLGLHGPPSLRAALVGSPGTPTASIIVAVSDFVEPGASAEAEPAAARDP